MSIRHTNPNMIRFVREGMASAELAIADGSLAERLPMMVENQELLTARLVPPGDRPVVLAQFSTAKAIAFGQGFLAVAAAAELPALPAAAL